MSSEALYGLDRPDELGDLELKGADQYEILETTYKTWLEITKEVRKRPDPITEDPIYYQACRIIMPFRERMVDELRIDELSFLEHYGWVFWGLYLSAVLNETKIKKLSTGKTSSYLPRIGYRLKPDKVVEITKEGFVYDAGRFAEGGAIINRGNVMYIGDGASDGSFLNHGMVNQLGMDASGGTFYNYRKVEEDMGLRASGGTHINRGLVKGDMGCNVSVGNHINYKTVQGNLGAEQAHGGVFINHGTASSMYPKKPVICINYGELTHSMGFWSKGGVFINQGKIRSEIGHFPSDSTFITTNNPKGGFLKELQNDSVYGIQRRQSIRNMGLRGLLKDLEKASKDEDFQEIRALARKIDGHVKETYKPRKIV